MAETPKPVLLQDATVDQLAEAIAAGVHVGLRRLLVDTEALKAFRKAGDEVFGDLDA